MTHAMARPLTLAFLLIASLCAMPASATTNCDTSYQNCRAHLIALMDAEQVEIDWMTWFVTDFREVYALERAHKRGVKVRVIGNSRYWADERRTMDYLKARGIPVRFKRGIRGSGAHTKAMIFAGQMVVEHGGANYSDQSFKPIVPYVNYTDEIVQFNDEPSIVQSFMRSFDDEWTDRTQFYNYGNAAGPERSYPIYAIDPRLQLTTPYDETAFNDRLVFLIDHETSRIQVIMYRLTSPRLVTSLLAALSRNIPVMILSDPDSMHWRTHGRDIRKLIAAGAQVKQRVHRGMTHEKFALFHSQGVYVLGSQNWDTIWSGTYEHNLFDNDAFSLYWMQQHFDRKWNAPAEFR